MKDSLENKSTLYMVFHSVIWNEQFSIHSTTKCEIYKIVILVLKKLSNIPWFIWSYFFGYLVNVEFDIRLLKMFLRNT